MQTYQVILPGGITPTIEAPCPPVDVSGTLVFYEQAGQGTPPAATNQAIATFPPGWLGWINMASIPSGATA